MPGRAKAVDAGDSLEARVARGTMTVRQLLDLRSGGILRSESKPGGIFKVSDTDMPPESRHLRLPVLLGPGPR